MRAKKPTKQSLAKAKLATGEKLPLIEHVHELRRRIFYIAACVAVGSGIAYALERTLINVLLKPSHGQHFIYTSPLGGMNFLFGVCLDIGLVLASPVIIYQLLAFLRPIMRDTTNAFLVFASVSALVVAVFGILFGYFIGLPSALHFLLHQFVTVQVKPLITIQSYMSFVSLYLFGSALMFQLPLIMIIINRIKPLKPSNLFKYERLLIIFAFVVAFIMNPTPNLLDHMLVVLPIIAMYQLGIGLIWFINRHKRPEVAIKLLREQDAARQAERASRHLRPLTLPAPEPAPSYAELDIDSAAVDPAFETHAPAVVEPTEEVPVVTRPTHYATGTATPVRRNYLPLRGQLVQ